MLDTAILRKLCRPVLALGLTAAVACVGAAGCIDNSGNKTYPRGDAAAETPDDADAGAPDSADDMPLTDAPAATDLASVDTPVDHADIDAPAVDTAAADTHADTAAIDTAAADTHADTGAGG
jgi:hypothetical protein